MKKILLIILGMLLFAVMFRIICIDPLLPAKQRFFGIPNHIKQDRLNKEFCAKLELLRPKIHEYENQMQAIASQKQAASQPDN